MRITVQENGMTPTDPAPEETVGFVAPIAYQASRFTYYSNGYDGRCSFCLHPAASMIPGGKNRWLALCLSHDRQHRWVKDGRNSWWYLPPPLANNPGAWWQLKYEPEGPVDGKPGWYLYEKNSAVMVETHETSAHRARASTELFLSCRSSMTHASDNETTDILTWSHSGTL